MATETGRTRHRIDWRGRLILQLEERFEGFPGGVRIAFGNERTWTEWRDADVDDILDGIVSEKNLTKPRHPRHRGPISPATEE